MHDPPDSRLDPGARTLSSERTHDQRGRDLWHAAASAAAIAVLSWSAVTFNSPTNHTALWWPAAGAAVAAVVSARAPARPWIVVLVVLVSGLGNVVGGRPLVVSALFGIANGVEAAVASWWIAGRTDRIPSLTTLADLGRLLVGALLGALAIAVGATATVTLLLDGPAWPTFPHLLASHASAVVLLVPLVLRQRSPAAEAGRLEVTCQAIVASLATVVVFGPNSRYPLAYLVMIPLVWGALRVRLRIVTFEVAGVLTLVLALTSLGYGPFAYAQARNTEPLLAFVLSQVFIISTFLIVMTMALVVTQRRVLGARVSDSERLLRAGFNDSLLGAVILRRGPDGFAVVEINQVAMDLLGLDTSIALDSQDWTGHIVGEAALLQRGLSDVHAGRTRGWRAEVELASPEGGRRWVEVAASAMSAENLVVLHLVDVTSRKRAEVSLEHLALYDPLTELPNRALVRDRLERALALAERDGTSVTVLFLDLDNFKRVNDTVGHLAGDEVLTQVASGLQAAVRNSDTVARLGGDEFLILLPVADRLTVNSSIERIMAAINQPIVIPAGTYHVSASIGIVSSHPGSTADELIRDADTAMYVSKEEGRDRATHFDVTHRMRALKAARVTADFEGAIERGELRLHIQPIVSLASGQVAAGEALVRWQHPSLGLLLPADWLDVAARGPHGARLERWILAEGCRLAGLWWRQWGEASPQIHVNVSTGLLLGGNLHDQVVAALAEADAPARLLVVELTETDLETVRGSLSRELVQLRQVGVRLSVDDFGTGYSAFNRLADLPLDELKIDQSFIAKMLQDDRSRAIVTAIVGLASSLGLETVGEGIETTQQAAFLREIGCSLGQGFLWSPAISESDFTRFINDRRSRPLPARVV